MKKSNLILVSFVISLSFLLNSCGAIVKGTALKRFTVENKVIPADFGKKDEVLLCVLKGRDSRDKYMKKHISKYYNCLLYTSPSPRDLSTSRMPSSA